MPVPATPASWRAPADAAQLELLKRAVRLAKREGASAVRMTRAGSIVIELQACVGERDRVVQLGPKAAARDATPTSASGGAESAPAPRRRRAGSASRRARSAARLRDFLEAKVHDATEQSSPRSRLGGLLWRALGKLRRERMLSTCPESLAQRGHSDRRSGGAKRAAGDLAAMPTHAAVPLLGILGASSP